MFIRLSFCLMVCVVAIAAFAEPNYDEDVRKSDDRKRKEFERRDENLRKRESALGDSESKARKELTRTEEVLKDASNKIDPYKISFGIHVGTSFANANVVPTVVTSNRFGFTLGGYIETPLMPGFLYLQPEFDFIQKGSENSHFGANSTTRLNYFEIPVLLKAKFTLPKVKPFVIAGFTMGYLLGGNVDGVPGVTTARFRSLEFGYVLGLGLNYPLGDSSGSPELTLCARLGSGFTNIDTVSGEWSNRALSVLAGMQF